MPYYTALPDGLVTLDVSGGIVVDTNTTYLLNDFSDSDEFDEYDVPGNQGAGVSVSPGDPITLVDDDPSDAATDPTQNSPSGTYYGDVTLSTASIELLGITVEVNPISGSLFQADDGTFYIVTDDPIREDGAASPRLGLTVTVPAIPPLPDTVLDIPLSELATNPLTASIAGSVQTELDTVVVTVEADGTGSIIVDDFLPCFVSGTLIEAAEGCRPVEELRTGDMVLTKDHGLMPIRWVGSRKLTKGDLVLLPHLRPIRISAGALGHGKPERDLLISPQHRILVHSKIAINMFAASEVLVAAKQLLLLDGIDYADEVAEVEYFHIIFDGHEIVMSNGAETESLYTGPEALKSMSASALREILELFPELAHQDPASPLPAARRLLSGREGRKLAHRHAQKHRQLLELH
ncbi:Hint domain-containing protein [Paracoccus zeaxanthinifaciens]|uniref:Hint domain-containing protein n=1 Tax=Paracoccus zeaxanthinifaciens TaxID=187400 RepID=UPI0003B5B8BB|nr:Hint domain-containing protein [Paracoccus zeaxanthinifaciens]